MAKKVLRVVYNALRLDEKSSFHQRVLHIVRQTTGECGVAFKRFEAMAAEFDKHMTNKALQPSLSLTELDGIADNAWSSLNMQIRASLMHPREAVRTAAQQVRVIFAKTSNPTMLNYDQEYGALQTLLSQLGTLPESVIKTALVDEHVQALRVAVDNFVAANNDKVDAQSKMQTGAVKTASADCYQAWQDLVKYLEIMDKLGGLAGTSEAIDQLNVMNANITRRLEARKLDKERAENIVDLPDDVDAV